MSKNYAGIDYGNKMTNIDINNGIRYGVIHMHEVLQAWADSSQPYYNCEECELYDPDECCEEICDPVSFDYDDEGYLASQDSMGDIMIVKSPYFTYAQFCSPCAPGACYLTNYLTEQNENNRAYCFGHDWFEDEVAPYPIYDVQTGKLVEK
jgi:hypothetical protein